MFPVGRIFYPPSSRFVPSEVIFVNQPPIFPKKTTPPAPPELRRRPAASPCQPLGLISPVNPRILTSGHVFRRGWLTPTGVSRCVSIPFTSGHVFRPKADHLDWSGRRDVSIPFTSGHVFRRPNVNVFAKKEGCLNPFYIRSRIPTFGQTGF